MHRCLQKVSDMSCSISQSCNANDASWISWVLKTHLISIPIVGVPHVLPWHRKRELVEQCLHVCTTRGKIVSRNDPPVKCAVQK